ncbi:hypothetical protein H6769_01895 [Candidatus Peribacteria bacterium]|nr:hypothetical protein [Candidatus Peribacteria bacterium]
MINIAISQYGMKLGDIFQNVTGQSMSEMKGSNILRNQALFQEGLRNAQAVMRSFFGENMNYGLSALMR